MARSNIPKMAGVPHGVTVKMPKRLSASVAHSEVTSAHPIGPVRLPAGIRAPGPKGLPR
jgi:hypothetical protein